MGELWVGWKYVREAEPYELKASGRDPLEGRCCAQTTLAPQVWVPPTPSRSEDEGRLRRGSMGWSEWMMDRREAKGCGAVAESPGLGADLRPVASHCLSLWVQIARNFRLPSVRRLFHIKRHRQYKTPGEYKWSVSSRRHAEVFPYLIQWRSSDRREQQLTWHNPPSWSRVFASCPSPERLSSAVKHPGTASLPAPARK